MLNGMHFELNGNSVRVRVGLVLGLEVKLLGMFQQNTN
jgi:hypothetical protein